MINTASFTIILYFLALSFPALSRAEEGQGIQFFEGSWSALLQQAEKENKPIFVDVYTDWCPPCKRMDKEVLPLAEVGKAYNTSFINYKLNAEKGEGIALAKQYEVGVYPTYLYLDPQGTLLSRVMGYQEPAQFIGYVKAALEKNLESILASMDKAFKEGKRDLAFLEVYIQQKAAVALDNSEAFDAYFEQLSPKELSDTTTIHFMIKNINRPSTAVFSFLLNRYPSLDKNLQQKVAPKLFELLDISFAKGFQNGYLIEAQGALQYMDSLSDYLNTKQLDHIYLYKLRYAIKVKDQKLAKEAAYAYVGKTMEITSDSIKREDKKRYELLMQPFWKGKQDSTKIDNFKKEKEIIKRTYTGELGVRLYEAIMAFDKVLDEDDPALEDALRWANRLQTFYPDREQMTALRERLAKKVKKTLPPINLNTDYRFEQP